MMIMMIPCQGEVICLGSRQVKVLEEGEMGDQGGQGMRGKHLEDNHDYSGI